MNKPQRLNREVIYENPWVNLNIDKVRFPGGRVIERHHILEFDRQAVAAVVQDDAGRFLLVHAYRYTTDRVEWEVPAGGVDPGEALEAAIQREIWEETGYQTESPQLLYSYNPMNGIANMIFHILYCKAGQKTGEPDLNEVQEARWFTKDEILEMIRGKEMMDGYTLTALLYWFTLGD